MSVNEKMTAIADAIRDKTGGTESLTLDDMATEIPKVFEEGKKAEYDAFWDAYQENGNRTEYQYGFSHRGWNGESFRPKYDIKPQGNASNTFTRFGGPITEAGEGVDMAGNLSRCGVKLDTSKATNLSNFCYYSKVAHVPEISTVGCTTTLKGVFSYCTLLTKIDKFILKSDGSNVFDSTFFRAEALVEAIFEGVIGQNGFDIHWSTLLNKASIESIINCLSTDTSGLTVTLSKTAVNNAFGIDIDDESTWTVEWNTLRNSKSNWTFSYA